MTLNLITDPALDKENERFIQKLIEASDKDKLHWELTEKSPGEELGLTEYTYEAVLPLRKETLDIGQDGKPIIKEARAQFQFQIRDSSNPADDKTRAGFYSLNLLWSSKNRISSREQRMFWTDGRDYGTPEQYDLSKSLKSAISRSLLRQLHIGPEGRESPVGEALEVANEALDL